MKALIVVGILVATLVGCGGDNKPNASTSGEISTNDLPKCEGWKPSDTDAALGCTEVIGGGLHVYGTGVHKCADGRLLLWNDYGWGYVGQPLVEHTPGAEKVAPVAELTACNY